MTNFGLRTLLNDLSVAQNARLAILTAAGFSAFAWLYTAPGDAWQQARLCRN